MSSVLWKEVLESLEKKVSRPNFVTWLKQTHYLGETNGLVRIGVSNPYSKTWIEGNVLADITSSLKKHLPNIEAVEIIIEPKESQDYVDLPLLQQTREIEEEQSVQSQDIDESPPLFNQKYTFENFIVGNNNRLAFAASQAVAEKPGTAYNPLFIYGGVGLGKTHLMHAIGNQVLKQSPKKKIIYTSCEVFTSDFIHSLQTKNINEFKKKYRTVDVLLIDDIQFLANKEGTQEEFFHTFNILHQANRQIVITSDRVPKEMTDLEDRLISRFGWGMIADIQSPNFENRVAILQAKAQEKQMEVPSDVLEYIANTITSNVRELEGSLTRLCTVALIEDTPITKAFTERVLKDLLQASATGTSPKKVIQVVSKYFNIEPGDILGKKRIKELVYPRQLVMYFLRERLNQSYPQIGDTLGGKDHTTIMHGVNKIAQAKKTNTEVERDIRSLDELLRV